MIKTTKQLKILFRYVGVMAEIAAIMATLDIKDPSANDIRILRKRPAKLLFKDTRPAAIVKNKRRCSLQPSKNSANCDSAESYYLNNKLKSQSMKCNLETIYEDPVVKKDGEVAFMGPVKMRRINFNGYVTKCKLKKRKIKVKKQTGFKGSGSGTSPSIKKGKRLTMDAFLARFHTLMSNNNSSGSNNKQDLLASMIE